MCTFDTFSNTGCLLSSSPVEWFYLLGCALKLWCWGWCRFLNKGLSDFNLALDLGFLTKARKYTFFKPQFIFYATYLSEKIGYWRYISIFRHLKQNPEYQCYPIFKYFENWCQDENRHGDFFSALMKAQPQFLNDWKAKLWARFFCLSVSIPLYCWNLALCTSVKKFYIRIRLPCFFHCGMCPDEVSNLHLCKSRCTWQCTWMTSREPLSTRELALTPETLTCTWLWRYSFSL